MNWQRQLLSHSAAFAALLVLVACGSPAESQLLLTITGPADTSEGGIHLTFSVDAGSGEAATWALEPELGSLTQISPTMVVFTPPETVQRRDAFTPVTLTATTPHGRGTAQIRVYPDPCWAGGSWNMILPSTMPNPPDGCGPCVVGIVCYGDQTPPASLLLGGSVQHGPLIETFDFFTCTYTVTAPSDGSVNDFCTWGTVTPQYAGVTSNFTFGRWQSTVDGQQRVVCWGATACCAPLLDVTLVRQ